MKAIVVGSDGQNTVGVIQCLGREGITVFAYLFSEDTGIVSSSKYVKKTFFSETISECINQLIIDGREQTNKIPIVACSDIVASQLEINKNELCKYYIFEHTTSEYTINEVLNKPIQLKIAKESGFMVPSFYDNADEQGNGIHFPCIIKPMISKEGSKSDLRVCYDLKTYLSNLSSLKYTKKYIVEQYIERDYEISIIGCGLSNGDCLIPAIEYKLTLYPLYTGLECLAKIEEFKDAKLIDCIKKFIKRIGYVGLFSIEMMHSKTDGEYYFTEINPRNDGANSFILKYGVNLPMAHVMDLLGTEYNWNAQKKKPGYYIWDIHHLKSFVHKDISIKQWISEIVKSKGFLMFDIHDMKPFFKQYTNWLNRKI